MTSSERGQTVNGGRATEVAEYPTNPMDEVRDVYVVDEHGQLLTGVRLLDQAGTPLDIGWGVVPGA